MYHQDSMNFIVGDYSTSPANDPADKSQPLDSWSVIWYIASFGGLIAFFLVVSCSEWCCRRNARHQNACRHQQNSTSSSAPVPDTPPPSYDHFAPPSYESLIYNSRGEKSQFDVYVVPVHTFGAIVDTKATHMDAPPSYTTASCNPEFHPACLPLGQAGTVPPIMQNHPLHGRNRVTAMVPTFGTNDLQTGTNYLPVGTNGLPTGTNDLPTGTNDLPMGTNGLPAGAHSLLTEVNELQRRAEDLRGPASTAMPATPQIQSHVVT